MRYYNNIITKGTKCENLYTEKKKKKQETGVVFHFLKPGDLLISPNYMLQRELKPYWTNAAYYVTSNKK